VIIERLLLVLLVAEGCKSILLLPCQAGKVRTLSQVIQALPSIVLLVASLAFLFYEISITFDDEVNIIWSYVYFS